MTMLKVLQDTMHSSFPPLLCDMLGQLTSQTVQCALSLVTSINFVIGRLRTSLHPFFQQYLFLYFRKRLLIHACLSVLFNMIIILSVIHHNGFGLWLSYDCTTIESGNAD